jgi:Zn-dependent M28 family amino/carboxypeptidase
MNTDFNFFPSRLSLAGLILFFVVGCHGTGERMPATTPTAQMGETQQKLREHVNELAEKIGPRNVNHFVNLETAAKYIETTLQQYGYRTEGQTFSAGGRGVRNIIAEKRGTSSPQRIFVVGAHYESADGSPGADSNASGVAATLELSRLLKNTKSRSTLRFVFFVCDQPPFVGTESMGSRIYAQRCKARGEKIAGMLDLDTLGYYTTAPKSQSYPFPFSLMRPSVGNFVAFVGNFNSKNFLKSVVTSFKKNAPVPVQDDAVPEGIAGLDTSAQWNFWKAGYPAVLVTDTSEKRNPHVNKSTDTAEKLSYDTFAQVVLGLKGVLEELGK